MTVIVLVAACYLVWRKSWLPGSFVELKNTILEARLVQDDLNSMLEKSLDVSREIVMSIDTRMIRVNEQEMEKQVSSPQLPADNNNYQVKPKAKIRIYELARILGVNSRDLIHRMQAAGYSYDNPLNTLDEVTAGIIIDKINSENKDEMDNLIQIQNQPPDEIAGQENQPAQLVNITDQVTCNNPMEIEDLEAWVESLKKAHPYVAVKALADKGYSIRSIAKLLERGQGEVSLILNLVNKKRACM
jgi:hypothetical protein